MRLAVSRAASRIASTRLEWSAVPRSGDVVRGAVIDRRAHDRQTERDVDGASEAEKLHRDQTLVVIAGDDGIEAVMLIPPREQRVGWQRAGHVEPAGAARRDHRRDHVAIFRADQSGLSGVRIEAGHGDSRPIDPDPGQPLGRQLDGVLQAFRRQLARHLRDRHVNRREGHGQRVGVKEHRDASRARQVLEQLGVPAPRQPRERERLLADRRRRDPCDRPLHRVRGCLNDRVVGGTAGLGRRMPRGECSTAGGWRRTVEDGFACIGDARICYRFDRDFGTDARGVPAGDADSGLGARGLGPGARLRGRSRKPLRPFGKLRAVPSGVEGRRAWLRSHQVSGRRRSRRTRSGRRNSCRSRSGCCSLLPRRSRRASRPSRSGARSEGSISDGRTSPTAWTG